MMKVPGLMSMVILATCTAGVASADDHEKLNDIYRLFFEVPVEVEAIEARYRDDVIHVGPPGERLLRGKMAFMEQNIAPFAAMINQGAVRFVGKAYIVRRIIIGDMANDVGYLHMTITGPDGATAEQVQKFSWVFTRSEGDWQVITDFDATPAPLAVLDNIEAQLVVEKR